jgi:PhnB protein
MSTKVTAHIVVGDAAEAARWYIAAFDATEIARIPLPGNKVMAVEIAIGESHIHIGSEFPAFGVLSPLSIGGTATVLQVNVDDVDAFWDRAVFAGATVRHPLANAFWGERHGQVADPFGHRWNLAQRLREVGSEEIAAAAAKIFGAQ